MYSLFYILALGLVWCGFYFKRKRKNTKLITASQQPQTNLVEIWRYDLELEIAKTIESLPNEIKNGTFNDISHYKAIESVLKNTQICGSPYFQIMIAKLIIARLKVLGEIETCEDKEYLKITLAQSK